MTNFTNTDMMIRAIRECDRHNIPVEKIIELKGYTKFESSGENCGWNYRRYLVNDKYEVQVEYLEQNIPFVMNSKYISKIL